MSVLECCEFYEMWFLSIEGNHKPPGKAKINLIWSIVLQACLHPENMTSFFRFISAFFSMITLIKSEKYLNSYYSKYLKVIILSQNF